MSEFARCNFATLAPLTICFVSLGIPVSGVLVFAFFVIATLAPQTILFVSLGIPARGMLVFAFFFIAFFAIPTNVLACTNKRSRQQLQVTQDIAMMNDGS